VSFYEREIAERQAFLFPPFCHLLKVICRRKTSSGAQKAASALRESLIDKFGSKLIIDGPAAAFQEKRGDYYYWQLVVKAPSRDTLLQVIASLPTNGCSYDIDPMNLL
jgi:primosomal protein N' (replication factor Y)